MTQTNKGFCKSLTQYERRHTVQVRVGETSIGSLQPIRVQSMTNTNTQDIEATVAQSQRIIDAGGELVRITAPGIKDAEALGEIRQQLFAKGYRQPLVADIHFNPGAATVAASLVEKVRINPGNFVDKKKFEHLEYTDAEYAAELEKIREKFIPLVHLCKANGTALRIGTNHGSLSDRILSRFGDTPMGMVESAMEFLRICVEENFYEVVLSMKASNTQVMVQAYRLLVEKMQAENMHFPLHLGVTEAGEAEDGRVKSAVGMGALLADGLGDTIRVSLTEEPEHEIPVAQMLVDKYANMHLHLPVPAVASAHYSPYEYTRRQTTEVGGIGGTKAPVVVADLTNELHIEHATLAKVGYTYIEALDKWRISDQAPDFIYVSTTYVEPKLPSNLRLMADYEVYQSLKSRGYEVVPVFGLSNYSPRANAGNPINIIRINYRELDPKALERVKEDPSVVLMLEMEDDMHQQDLRNKVAENRAFFLQMLNYDFKNPVIIHQSYKETNFEVLQIHASADTGILFIDGFGDGLMVSNRNKKIGYEKINALAFNILQATRVRVSKTEYISCPSCGRTLFDLQETTARIRKVTSHLKGLKIGIMGCIVNGPGEMADAHYGYVGTGHGRITLYKGKEVVKRNIPSEEAVDALIELIKTNGDWVEPDNTL